MPRKSRIILPGEPVHVIQRGRNRKTCFFYEEDYKFYLQWLEEYANEAGCSIHAYVLMPSHIHLLLTPDQKNSVAVLMKRLGQRYVQYINRAYQRSGTLWDGRFRSCVAQQEKYLFFCQQFIELNPVRSAYASDPADYQWSSYRINALGEKSTLVKPHSLYLDLGDTCQARQTSYRKMFARTLHPSLITQIIQSTNGDYALGGKRFIHDLAKTLGRKVVQGKPGRPRKDLLQSS